MTERATTTPPRMADAIGRHTRIALTRGPYESNGGSGDLTSLEQRGLVVTGNYSGVHEVKKYDPTTETWETIPVQPKTLFMPGRRVVTVFEPVTESPKGLAR
ncbi:MAG: hypothetical protein HYZ02_00150 [Candidatus Levybacteria bacterium]|nr:hypothetical protein [Candidatus Levybacteria bacterium]